MRGKDKRLCYGRHCYLVTVLTPCHDILVVPNVCPNTAVSRHEFNICQFSAANTFFSLSHCCASQVEARHADVSRTFER